LTTRIIAEKRRENVYTLYLRGASIREIAEVLRIPRSVVHYDIEHMRRRNAEWFEEQKEPETRMQSLFKEMWDRVHDIVVEVWKLYENIDEHDLRLKSELLSRVQRAVDMQRALMMTVTPTMDDVENRRVLKDLEQRLQCMEENRRAEELDRSRIQSRIRLMERERSEPFNVPDDPVTFCRDYLGFRPTEYQVRLLRDPSQFIVARWSRQSGKSHIVSVLLLWLSLRNPNHNIIILAPSLRQSKIIIRRITGLLKHLPKSLAPKPLRTKIDFSNGSQIQALPNNPETIRGEPGVHLVYCDEFNYIADDSSLYDAVIFTLATTNGRFLATSTPGTRDSIFYRMCTDNDNYEDVSRHHVHMAGCFGTQRATQEADPRKNQETVAGGPLAVATRDGGRVCRGRGKMEANSVRIWEDHGRLGADGKLQRMDSGFFG